jgi:hypothetical protein
MIDFKLISVDDHVNEHPAAWERAQREFGERAPHVIENPPELGKGLWIIAEGLPPCARLISPSATWWRNLKVFLK